MDWLTLSGGVPSLSLIPLGILHNNKYYISDDCLREYNFSNNCIIYLIKVFSDFLLSL
jgi:hypothetical protein